LAPDNVEVQLRQVANGMIGGSCVHDNDSATADAQRSSCCQGTDPVRNDASYASAAGGGAS
jgi:hypothetical protein